MKKNFSRSFQRSALLEVLSFWSESGIIFSKNFKAFPFMNECLERKNESRSGKKFEIQIKDIIYIKIQ